MRESTADNPSIVHKKERRKKKGGRKVPHEKWP